VYQSDGHARLLIYASDALRPSLMMSNGLDVAADVAVMGVTSRWMVRGGVFFFFLFLWGGSPRAEKHRKRHDSTVRDGRAWRNDQRAACTARGPFDHLDDGNSIYTTDFVVCTRPDQKTWFGYETLPTLLKVEFQT